MYYDSTIHIGSEIRRVLSQQGRSIVWLADQLGIKRPNCYRIIRSKSLQTENLLRISQLLDYDFFAIYSKVLSEK